MTWASSGLAVGIALASPFAGAIIDTSGAQVAYWVTSGCAFGALAVAALVGRSLSRALVGAEPQATRVLASAPALRADSTDPAKSADVSA